MRTNIVIDDKLIEEAIIVSGAKTKREVVQEALKELIRAKKRKNMLELAGSIEFATGYDYKKMRKLRNDPD
jgi:Arc/MetJ family transcription regulator